MARIRRILFSPGLLMALALPALILAGEFPCESTAHRSLCAFSAIVAISGWVLDWRRERRTRS